MSMPDPEDRHPRRPAARTLIFAGAASAVIALVLSAGVAGWAVANASLPTLRGGLDTETVYISVPEYDSGSGTRMPDVRGLPRAEAVQVLTDAGIPAALVSLTVRPAAGPADVVVQQTPVFGTVDPAVVELVVSESAAIPDLIGQDATQAIAQLYRLGARVVQVREYVPELAPGLVAAVSPAPGDPVPASVNVTVSDSPTELPLSDLDPALGSAGSKDQLLVSGRLRDSALSLSAGWSSPTTVGWSLGAHAVTLAGAFALADDGDDGVEMVVVARRDGQELGTYTISKGSTVPFEWDLRGATTLTLEVSSRGDDREPVYLLDAVIRGSYDQIQLLTP